MDSSGKNAASKKMFSARLIYGTLSTNNRKASAISRKTRNQSIVIDIVWLATAFSCLNMSTFEVDTSEQQQRKKEGICNIKPRKIFTKDTFFALGRAQQTAIINCFCLSLILMPRGFSSAGLNYASISLCTP